MRTNSMHGHVAIAFVIVSAAAVTALAKPKPLEGKAIATLAPVAQLPEVPVGIAISNGGRTFLSFSRAVDPMVSMSVAELDNGKAVPFPKGFKQDDGAPAADRLLSVQALTVDAKDRLWILDSGKVGTNGIEPGSAKLIAWDLASDREVKRIAFPPDVAGRTAFLNDVRIDLSRGAEGTAFLTDASPMGPNGIVVVDLASGRSFRKLQDHAATKPVKKLKLEVEGKPLVQKKGPAMDQPLLVGADGIALDGQYVYWSPLTSHHLYRARADELVDERSQPKVEDHGDKGFAADGLLGDAQGRIYSTDFERSAIHRREKNGTWTLIAQGRELDWPDSMALAADGALFVTTTQIARSPWLQGRDKRTKPFTLYRVKTDSTPLLLGAR